MGAVSQAPIPVECSPFGTLVYSTCILKLWPPSGTPTGAAQNGAGGDNSGAKPVGAPCVPAEEQLATFSGLGYVEASIETNLPQCASKICMARNFRR